jgi:Flp pilus assembly protein TadG
MSGIADRLASDRAGSMAIETAIVAPVLLLLSLGAFQVSMMVARQSELQSAAAEAGAIVMAVKPTTAAQLAAIERVVESSSGLAPDQVTITRIYRCGTSAAYTETSTACGSEEEVSTFLRVAMTDRYTPEWARFGVGRPLTYRVTRMVQVS